MEISRKNIIDRVLNRGRRACPACFLCYFLHAAKSNSPFPFRELPDKQEARPCWGSTLRVLLLPFSLKHGRLAHIRSQFSLFRRSPTHKNLPLATFCTSEQLLFGSFCRSKKNKLVPFRELPDKQEVCPCRGSTLRVQGSFEVLQTSKQLTAKAVSLEPLRGISRRPSRLNVPFREHFPAFKKAG